MLTVHRGAECVSLEPQRCVALGMAYKEEVDFTYRLPARSW